MSFKNERFHYTKYYSYGATGTGASAADPAAPVDGKVCTIPAGGVVQEVNCIVTAPVTGTITIGDATDPDGFATSTEITEGSKGAYNGNGAYLTGGLRKYYEAATDVALDQTTISAGAFAIVVQGYRI